jgi:uncharacterized protein (TIGR02594 family)
MRTAARRQAVPAHAQRTGRPAFGWPSLVTEARKYIGTNPTAMNRRWCARFLNFVLNKTGYSGTNSDAARSFASYGRRVSEPKVGAIAVLTRGNNRNLGHVGIVTGIDANGNPIIISGNHGHRVGESAYPRARVIAYVMPTAAPARTMVASAGPIAPRANDVEHGLSSPIDELLAAINSESAPRLQQRPAPVVMQASAQVRIPASLPPAAQPARPVRLAQVNVPLPTPAPGQTQVVPQPRPAPYRLVQQTPTPLPDPRVIR